MLGGRCFWFGVTILVVLGLACDSGRDKPPAKQADAKTASVAPSKGGGSKGKQSADAKAEVDKSAGADKEPAPQEAATPEEPEAKAADPAADPKPGPQVIEDVGLKLEIEMVGPIHVGMKAAEVVEALGKPKSKSKPRYEAATGFHTQTWEYPSKGLSLGMAAESAKGADNTLDRITVAASCTLPLPWGLKMGSSSRAEVEKIYGTDFDPTWNDENTFIAGDVYGGSEYRFKDGKITGLFIGASAE